MQSDVLKKIAGDIETSDDNGEGEKIVFGKKGYTSFIIDRKNFEKTEIRECGKRIAFIDGGNSEIIGSTNFSVQMIRACCCVFKDNKKTDEIKNEFFVLANPSVKDDDVFFNVKTYPLNGNFRIDNFSVNSADEKISEGGRRAKIAKTGDIARRMSEIRLAEDVIENEKADIIVFDGTLECTAGEKEFLDRVYENALIKDKTVCALAKTTNFFTDRGKNALAYINKIGPEGIWRFSNFADIDNDEHIAEISAVKLHGNSKHCFRFEIFKRQKEKTEEVLGYLASNSKDISFPGYPYGLIAADKCARVSNKEKDYLRSLFLARCGDTGKLAEEMISADSHGVLDNIN